MFNSISSTNARSAASNMVCTLKERGVKIKHSDVMVALSAAMGFRNVNALDTAAKSNKSDAFLVNPGLNKESIVAARKVISNLESFIAGDIDSHKHMDETSRLIRDGITGFYVKDEPVGSVRIVINYLQDENETIYYPNATSLNLKNIEVGEGYVLSEALDEVSSLNGVANFAYAPHSNSSKYGVPDYCTDSGIKEHLEAAGVFHTPDVEVLADDMGDDGWYGLYLEIMVPVDVKAALDKAVSSGELLGEGE